MERLTGKDAKLMMEALAAVYEKKGDCVDKDKKTKHNCAKKVCSEQWGEGTCVPEHHTLLEDGTVTHYDVVFEHGLERMVPIQELEVLVTEMHEHASMEGGHIDEGINDDPRFGVLGQVGRLGAKMFGNASQRNNAVSYERSINDLRKSRGGGNVSQGADGKPITAAQIAAETKRRRLADPKYKPGQGVDSGAKPGSGGTSPAVPSNNAVASTSSAPAPARDRMANASKAERMAAFAKANPKLAARQAERDRTRGTSATTNPLMKDMKSRMPAPAPSAAQKQASVNAAVKSANRPEVLNKQAPAGSALRRQQDKQAAAKPTPGAGAAAGSMKSGTAAGGSGGSMGAAAGRLAPKPTSNNSGQSVGKTKEMMDKGKKAIFKKEDLDVFDTIKDHLITEHEFSEDVAIKLMSILDEETRGDIMEYTAAIRADAAPKGTTMRMTAGGKEPPGDRLLRGIKDRVGGFLQKLNPKAMKSTNGEPRKPLVSTQKNSYELEGELVDEGSCGSKKKKKSKKGGY
jgi:hypothetical protein